MGKVVVQAWLALGWGHDVLWYIYLFPDDQDVTYYFSMWIVHFDMSKSGSPTAALLAGWNSYWLVSK